MINSNENRDAQQQLRSVTNHKRVFDNATECEIHIRQLKNDEIILIVSGKMGSIIVPLIHSLKQINSIYVYCLNFIKHHKCAAKFAKIQAIITNLNELIEKIKMAQKLGEKSFDKLLPISIIQPSIQ